MTETTFLVGIRQALSEWPALQMAIEHGFGGDEARQKEAWMATVIQDLFHDNHGQVDVDELADYVGEIVDNEFETIVEDGSLRFLATLVCRYYAMFTTGGEAQLKQIIDQKQKDLDRRQQVRRQEMNQLEAELRAMAVPPPDEAVNAPTNPPTSSQPVEEDDGWTVVNNSGRKKHSPRK